MISPEKIAEMLAAAEKAAKGPWSVPEDDRGEPLRLWPYDSHGWPLGSDADNARGTAYFIARCDPATITEILSELLTLRAERDEARELVAEANNSLYGSQGYFHSLNGGQFDKYHLANGIEDLKANSRAEWRRAEAAEAQLARQGEALKRILDANDDYLAHNPMAEPDELTIACSAARSTLSPEDSNG